MLEGMIRTSKSKYTKTFKISKPNFLKISKVQNFGKEKYIFK